MSRDLGGLHRLSELFGEEEMYLSLPGFAPRIVESVA